MKSTSTCLRQFLFYTIPAMFIYAICAGFRDNYGIMLPCLVEWSGTSYASVSFIIALGQLLFGMMQPVFGFLSVRKSPRFVLCTGVAMMLSGLFLLPVSKSVPMLAASLGILLPSGTAAASFGIIMSCVEPLLQPSIRHFSSGVVASGIGLGICVISPVMQAVISSGGLSNAIAFLAVPVALLIPMSLWITSARPGGRSKTERKCGITLAEMGRAAVHDPAYGKVAFGFFTCGFHMAMIQTHLFSQLTGFGISAGVAAYALSAYGLGTIAGAVGSGIAIARLPMHRVLCLLYSSRVAWVLLLMLPLPAPLLFADIFMLGLTGVATVAPTSGLILEHFGPGMMATLFGFAYLLHQAGAFLSAWAGGLCHSLAGSYSGIWYADIILCFLAGAACLSIRKTGRKMEKTE